MKERIQEYMDYKNINAGELASLLEVQRSNISHILNGRNKPSAAFIEKMLAVFQDLNARWLLTGQGSMLTSSVYTSVLKSESEDEPVKQDAVISKNATDTPPSINTQSDLKENTKLSVWDETIDKIVLFYKDGTFTSFNNRSKK